MIWKTANLKAIQSLFIGEEGANLVKIYDFNGLDSQKLGGNTKRNDNLIGPANQIISLWACSVRSKRRHGECAGEHSASLCAPSILAHWGAIMPSAGTITGSNFSNEVSANVARQSSFFLRGHSHTESTCEQKQGSESLPTHFMKNEKTMKNRSNPFSVSSSGQSYNTKANRFAGRLRSAGLNTTAVLSVILGCSSTAALAWLAVIGVNLALISAAVLLIYIIFGSIVSRSVTNCHRIQ